MCKSHAEVSCTGVGSAFTENNVLHAEASAFTAEAYAVMAAIQQIKRAKLHKVVIFTDFLNIMKSQTSSRKHKNPVLKNLYSPLCAAHTSNQGVIICWVSGH